MEADSSGASMMKGTTQSPATRKTKPLQLRVRFEILYQHDRDNSSLIDWSASAFPSAGQQAGLPAPTNLQ
jgi:hypothetical protein